MNRKIIILPMLALILATMACLVQVTPTLPPGPTAVAPTGTSLPLAPSATPVAPTPTALTLDMLRNGTYYLPNYKRTVKLVSGAYTEGSGADQYSVKMLDTVAFGDMNDARNDLASSSSGCTEGSAWAVDPRSPCSSSG